MFWIQILSLFTATFADLIGYNRLGNNVYKHQRISSHVRRRSTASDQVLKFLNFKDDAKNTKSLMNIQASKIAQSKRKQNYRRLRAQNMQ